MKHATIIYLGSYCNKNCSYCDRSYIKTEIGDTRLNLNQIPTLLSFLSTILDPSDINSGDPILGFHGGEPFLYTDQMSNIIDSVLDTYPGDYKFSILTNGTLIERNHKFLERYGSRLTISISYDFLDIGTYRGYELDLVRVLETLIGYGVTITQIQWVVPMNDTRVFDVERLVEITKIYSKFNIGMLTLIPLRHIRGKSDLDDIIEKTELQGFMRHFIKFIQMLYVLDINISIDGHSHDISKDYFNNHKQIILSPDGYIYPEFDFLDYQIKDARIGSWVDKTIDRGNWMQDFDLVSESCLFCDQSSSCGIKYLYHHFNKEPSGKCKQFYKYLSAVIEHYGRLRKYNNLVEAVK